VIVDEVEVPHEHVVTKEDAVTAQGGVAMVLPVVVEMEEVEVETPETPLHLGGLEAREVPHHQEEEVGRREDSDLEGGSVHLEGDLQLRHLPPKLQKRGGPSSTSGLRQWILEWRSSRPSSSVTSRSNIL
jgi:hypothetical protein